MTAVLTRPTTVTKAPTMGPIGVGVLLLCVFLPVLDFFIVNVALPTMHATLHAPAPMLELVVAGYGTAYAALLVLGGRLGDTFGRRRVLLIGLAGFGLTSLLCGLAPGIGTLVGFRIAQAVAAALIVPQVLGTFQAALDGPRRARALGLYGATGGIASVVGQVLGGLIVTADIAGTNWRPIFLLNVPVAIAAVIAVPRFVPATRSSAPAGADVAGTVLFAGTLVALLVPLTEGRALGWPLWTWLVLALAPVLAVATALIERDTERRGRLPLLPPSLVALRSVRRGLAFGLPFFLGFGAFMFVFALTVQGGLHADALHSGLAILPMAITFLLGSLLAPRLIDRIGRGALGVGALLQVVGLVALIVTVSGNWPQVSLLSLAPGLLVTGLGQSFAFVSLFRLILADVPPELAGVGGGVLITLQQSGLALGVAVLGTLFLSIHDVGTAFAVTVGIQAVIGIVVAIGSRTLPAAGGVAVPVEG